MADQDQHHVENCTDNGAIAKEDEMHKLSLCDSTSTISVIEMANPNQHQHHAQNCIDKRTIKKKVKKCKPRGYDSSSSSCESYTTSSFARRPLETENTNPEVKATISRSSILGGNTFIARKRTNLKDQCNLVPLEGDQEIFEEDAVCEICFNTFKVNEEMVKRKCKCKSEEFVHEACAAISNCGVCEQQVEKIHLILLQLPTDDAGVTAHNNGKKFKWFSLFKW